jgi:hypothetical protein
MIVDTSKVNISTGLEDDAYVISSDTTIGWRLDQQALRICSIGEQKWSSERWLRLPIGTSCR